MASDHPYPYFICLFLVLLPLSTSAQTFSNISLGKSLTAGEASSFLASPSGDFAFGFQQIEEDGFLLAIWFNKISERTVVWSANGQSLAPKGSKVELTSDGWFLLNDPTGNQIWNASPSRNEVAYAAMLDTGNFVLAAKDSQNLWESFDQPTDTILPGQVLNQPARLVSRYLATNYSRGRFQFVLQDDGNLELYTTHFPLDIVNFAYWNTHVSGNGFSLVFNQSGYIFLQSSNGSIIYTISSDAISAQNFYQRAILDYDGVFKHYIYPKSNSSSNGSWPMAWSTKTVIPPNICLSINGGVGNGSGACGYNSYCSFDDTKSCHCPIGYSFIDPKDVMLGCKQDFVSQSCDETSSETHLFYLIEKEHLNWQCAEYEHVATVNEDWCRQACLDDCYCALAYFSDGMCWKKSQPFSNGILDSSVVYKSLIKIRRDNSTLISGNTDDNNRPKLIIIGSVLLSSSVLLYFLLLVVVCVAAYRFSCIPFWQFGTPQVQQVVQFSPGINLRNFTYEGLSKATNGFTEELGRGSFAIVYKGTLLGPPGNLIAVKRLNMVRESEGEFEAEVSAIGQTHHRNLVQLLGFCNEGEHKLLVYEFMSKGNLASFLFDGQKPSWYQRVKIATGIARGLLYLHEECATQIIHCDIKPQNILLDDSCTPKISDFGLAKLLKIDQSLTKTAMRGTRGYVAAEWFKNIPITMKVDVYSYGVVLFELICCKRSIDIKAENENEMVLTDWVYDCFQDRRFDLLVKDDKEALDDIEGVEKYVMIGFWCTQEDPSLRPTMKQVFLMLEGFIEVPNFPGPPSFTSTT